MVSFVVEDEILYGLENFSIPGDEIEERLLSALEAVGILPLRYRTIDSLSGGQKQKVAIAAIIALRPKVLILDEPTSELDPKSSEQIFELLKRLNEKYGITIVVIEQKIMLLSEYVKKLAVMNKGRIIFSGNVRDVLGHSSELEEIGIHCPRVVSLSNSLRDRGADVDGVWINLDEAEAGIRRMIYD
jgi:energy-coupling factor transport system ATP-binding protein